MNAPDATGAREAAFSLGSNQGDRRALLVAAREHLQAIPGTRLCACSGLYETEPVDVSAAYRHLAFLNAVILMEGPLAPRRWLEESRHIEQALGRRRGADRNAPRTIDIDLLYCGAARVNEPGLHLPHPRWLDREFVLRPLADVRPGLRLPGRAGTIETRLEKISRPGAVRLLARAW